MQPFFEDYLNNQELHNDIQSTIEEFPKTALDWTPPGSSLNSLSVLIIHFTGAESYWLGDVVARESFGRDREAEFQAHEMGLDALTDRLTDSLVYARRVLEKSTLQDLNLAHFAQKWASSHGRLGVSPRAETYCASRWAYPNHTPVMGTTSENLAYGLGENTARILS